MYKFRVIEVEKCLKTVSITVGVRGDKLRAKREEKRERKREQLVIVVYRKIAARVRICRGNKLE